MLKKWLATFAVAGLVLAGCGEDSESSNGGGNGNGNGTTNVANQLTLDNFAERVIDAQYAAGSANFTMEMDIAGESVATQGSAIFADTVEETAMIMTMSFAGETVEMRLIGGIAYMDVPGMPGWMAMDLADLAQLSGQDLSQVDPGMQLESVNEGLVSIEPTGETTEMDGVEVQAYALLIDMSEYLGEFEGSEAVEGIDEQFEATMWVGVEDDLVRRMEMSFDLEGETMSMSMSFSDWGTDVTVEAPPEDEVTDFADLLGDM